MAAKTVAPAPKRLDETEIRAQITQAQAADALAKSEEQTETLRLPMLAALSEIGSDTESLPMAKAKIAAATQKRVDAAEHLARLQPLLIIARWRDLQIQKSARLHLISERTASYKKRKARWDALQAELYELEPLLHADYLFVSSAGTDTIDNEIEKFRIAHATALRDAGEIAF
jgi:maltooligosyltrehalose synthase